MRERVEEWKRYYNKAHDYSNCHSFWGWFFGHFGNIKKKIISFCRLKATCSLKYLR